MQSAGCLISEKKIHVHLAAPMRPTTHTNTFETIVHVFIVHLLYFRTRVGDMFSLSLSLSWIKTNCQFIIIKAFISNQNENCNNIFFFVFDEFFLISFPGRCSLLFVQHFPQISRSFNDKMFYFVLENSWKAKKA